MGLRTASDFEILAWAAETGRVVLSHDARTMPRHAHERFRQGLPMPGLVVVPQRLGTGAAIEDLELLLAGDRSDFENQIIYLPLG